MTGPNHDAVVIGGGVAGLVTARDLARAGLDVCLIEATNTLGGRVHRELLAGLPVELGAEAFATRGGAVAELLRELGLAEDVVAPDPEPAWLVTAHATHPLPESGALGIPAHPLRAATRRAIGLRAAFALSLEPWRPRTRHTPGASLADVARARIGARATATLVAPVTEGVYSASPDTLRFEAQHELARAYERSGSLVRAAREVRGARQAAGGAVAGLAGGMSQMTARLEAELRTLGVTVRMCSAGTAIERLAAIDAAPDQPQPDAPRAGWRVRWAGGECAAAAVVLAVPPVEVGRLLGGVGTVASTSVADIAVETVALVMDAPLLDRNPRGPGALIRPDHPHIAAKALTHATAKWAWLREAAPPGRHVVRLSYGSRGVAPATARLDDNAAAALALRDAAKVLGVPLEAAQLVVHTRRRWSIPARAEPPALPPGLACTGEAYAGTGLASVVPHARRVAREVAAAIAPGASETTPQNFTPSPPEPLQPQPRAAVHDAVERN